MIPQGKLKFNEEINFPPPTSLKTNETLAPNQSN
jgi:hypothetical protein